MTPPPIAPEAAVQIVAAMLACEVDGRDEDVTALLATVPRGAAGHVFTAMLGLAALFAAAHYRDHGQDPVKMLQSIAAMAAYPEEETHDGKDG